MGPILGLIKVDANIGNFVWVGSIMTPVVTGNEKWIPPSKRIKYSHFPNHDYGRKSRLPSLIGEIK